mmetsp:Transcript_30155/g.97288  ORF Transcript_30155/g.97288 Transcript_30155/m.97288 type:complete len:274 (-) Transcript_30155:151-972(-)
MQRALPTVAGCWCGTSGAGRRARQAGCQSSGCARRASWLQPWLSSGRRPWTRPSRRMPSTSSTLTTWASNAGWAPRHSSRRSGARGSSPSGSAPSVKASRSSSASCRAPPGRRRSDPRVVPRHAHAAGATGAQRTGARPRAAARRRRALPRKAIRRRGSLCRRGPVRTAVVTMPLLGLCKSRSDCCLLRSQCRTHSCATFSWSPPVGASSRVTHPLMPPVVAAHDTSARPRVSPERRERSRSRPRVPAVARSSCTSGRMSQRRRNAGRNSPPS